MSRKTVRVPVRERRLLRALAATSRSDARVSVGGMSWSNVEKFVCPRVGDIVELPPFRGSVQGLVVKDAGSEEHFIGWVDVLLDDG